ncbi:hypothetical protein [Dactylosporangium cerinum]
MRNEDLLRFPASWLSWLYPRRGGVAVPAPFPTKDAAKKLERLVAAKAGDLTGSLAHPETDPDLRAAAQGWRRRWARRWSPRRSYATSPAPASTP